jgi:hypothetical protein
VADTRKKRVLIYRLVDLEEDIALNTICNEPKIVGFLRELATGRDITLDEDGIQRRIVQYQRVKDNLKD